MRRGGVQSGYVRVSGPTVEPLSAEVEAPAARSVTEPEKSACGSSTGSFFKVEGAVERGTHKLDKRLGRSDRFANASSPLPARFCDLAYQLGAPAS